MNRLALWLAAGLMAAASAAARAENETPKPTQGGEESVAPKPDDASRQGPRHPIGERIREHLRERSDRGDAPELTRGPGIFRDVSDEEIQAILAFARDHLPWLSQSLEQARQSDPEQFRAVCRRLRFEIGQLRALKESDEAAFQKALEEKRLQFLARGLAERFRAAASDEDRTRLREELRRTLAQLVDAELVTREAQIRLLEKRLEDLRADLKDRAAKREAIVEKRLGEMLSGEADRHEPPPPDAPPPPPRPKTDG